MSLHAPIGEELARTITAYAAARRAGEHDRIESLVETATGLAFAMFNLPNPLSEDFPHLALALAWRCTGSIPSEEDEPQTHAAAGMLLEALTGEEVPLAQAALSS